MTLAPLDTLFQTRALKESDKGCQGIYAKSATQAFALISNSGTWGYTQVYISQIILGSIGSVLMTFKRYSSIAQTFSFSNTKIKMGIFKGDNLYFSGHIKQYSGISTAYTEKMGFLMKIPYLETSTLVTGETCQDYYVQYFWVDEETTSTYDRTSVKSSISYSQTFVKQSTQSPIVTTSLATSNFEGTPLRISTCNRPSCTAISISSLSAFSNSYTIGSTFTSYEPSPTFSANNEACPIAFTVTITEENKGKGKSNTDVTSTMLNSLFKIYDHSNFKQKAFSAQMTSDTSLESDYTVKLTASLASATVKVQDYEYKAKYVTSATPASCATATISINTQTFPIKTYQDTISSPENITYSSPFDMSSASCFSIKIIQELSTNSPTWPIYLAPGSNDFQINYLQQSTQSLTQKQITYKYRFQATNSNSSPKQVIESSQIVYIIVQHLCYDVNLQPSTDISTYYVIGEENRSINITNLSLNHGVRSCPSQYIIEHINSTQIDNSNNWFFNLQSFSTKQTINLKKQTLSSISPGIFSIRLKGWVLNSNMPETYTSIKVTICRMDPNSQDIDISSSTKSENFTKPYTYKVGDPTLKISVKQFSTDSICSNQPIQLTFKYLNNDLTLSELPSFISGTSNTASLKGGYLEIQTNTRSFVVSQSFNLAVIGSFLISPSIQIAKLIVPITIKTVNKGPPVLESQLSIQNIKISINEYYQIKFGKVTDPDEPDDTYKVSCDFGGASSFTTGNFPNYLVNPKSNSTDPGIYSVTVTLTDTNPDPLSTIYTFQITVLALSTSITENSTLSILSNQTSKTKGKVKVKPIIGQKDLEANISKITSVGEATITFNQEVLVPGNFTQIRDDVLKINVMPGIDSHEKLLQIQSWNVTNFTSTQMKINIIFENPLAISVQSNSVDKLQILVVQSEFFNSAVSPGLMLKEGTILQKNLNKQMKLDGASLTLMASGGTAQTSLNSMMYANLGIQIVMSASMQMLWGLVNVMQLIVQLPLLNVTFPQNAATFYSFISDLSSFELIPSDSINKAIFNFTTKEENDPNFNKMGIETDNVIQNLGSMFIYLIGFVFLLSFTIFLSFFKKYHRYIEMAYIQFSKMVFYNMILRLILEGYMDYALSSLLNIKNMIWKTPSDKFASVFSIAAFTTILSFPFLVAIIVWRKQKQLAEQQSVDKYGAIYNELRVKNYPALLYNVFQMLRRLMIATLAVYFKEWSYAQIQLIIFHCIILITYIIFVKPFQNSLLNKLEVFNELCIMFATYHLLIFNDFVPDLEIQYLFGWSMIGISIFNIVINVIIMAKEQASSLKKLYQIIKRKILSLRKARKEQYKLEQTQAANQLKVENQEEIEQKDDQEEEIKTEQDVREDQQERQRVSQDNIQRRHRFDSGQVLILQQLEKEHAVREKDRIYAGIGITRHLLKPDQVLESLETEFFINNKMPGRGWRNKKMSTDDKVPAEVVPPLSYSKKTQRIRETFRSSSEEGEEELKNIEFLNTK